MKAPTKRIFWHGELPPLEAEMLDEHWLVARSDRTAYQHGKHDLWPVCTPSLRTNLEKRIDQELERLGGHYAHILDERVIAKIDHETSEYWLEGRYDYVSFRDPQPA